MKPVIIIAIAVVCSVVAVFSIQFLFFGDNEIIMDNKIIISLTFDCAKTFDDALKIQFYGGNEIESKKKLDMFYDNWCSHNIDQWIRDSEFPDKALNNNGWMKFYENILHNKIECGGNYDQLCMGVGMYDFD